MLSQFGPFQTGDDRYQPKSSRRFGTENAEFTFDQQRLAVIVGIIALLLPAVLFLTGLITGTSLKDSISHYFYTPYSSGFFTVMLGMIAMVLLAYRGETDDENLLANFAGVAAALVAILPTSRDGYEGLDHALHGYGQYSAGKFISDNPFELYSFAGTIHLVMAGILFFFLGWISRQVFTRIDEDEHLDDNGNVKPTKLKRNKIYKAMANVVFACIFLLIAKFASGFFGVDLKFWNEWNLTFVVETIAMTAFGVSWCIKGRIRNVLSDQRDEAVLKKLGYGESSVM